MTKHYFFIFLLSSITILYMDATCLQVKSLYVKNLPRLLPKISWKSCLSTLEKSQNLFFLLQKLGWKSVRFCSLKGVVHGYERSEEHQEIWAWWWALPFRMKCHSTANFLAAWKVIKFSLAGHFLDCSLARSPADKKDDTLAVSKAQAGPLLHTPLGSANVACFLLAQHRYATLATSWIHIQEGDFPASCCVFWHVLHSCSQCVMVQVLLQDWPWFQCFFQMAIVYMFCKYLKLCF